MRSVVESKKIILKGDTTITGGEVLNGSDLVNQQLSVACKGAPVFCPACKQTGAIAEGSNLFNIQGIPVALEGHFVNCGCPTGKSTVIIIQC
ncbi:MULTISPECIES: PAAR domain-containing protein [Photorhabdus]|uniref:PAAR domain-containing protein n=1 Tax=Photorhabdus TaxID=29487 RepID=UPI00052E23F1|nr:MULTISPECIES: PAAR domain-containing protein [Photorhabdus]KGM26038.1 PAAR motif protein family protein [Photorhabdus luminescens]MBS9431030.1 PAAR domain-containing protein [Photorhabdus akhurstii]MCC8457482.1 PAAR domain-containing protein [Photorhabdus aegyptia]